jgi:hypothetical protein
MLPQKVLPAVHRASLLSRHHCLVPACALPVRVPLRVCLGIRLYRKSFFHWLHDLESATSTKSLVMSFGSAWKVSQAGPNSVPVGHSKL